MANPPITIGPFSNVPAPGSPIKSDWPQEISTYVNALPRGTLDTKNGPTSDQSIAPGAAVDITGLTITWTADSTRRYRTMVDINLLSGATIPTGVVLIIANGSGGIISNRSITFPTTNHYEAVQFELAESALTGAVTRKVQISTTGGVLSAVGSFQRVAQFALQDMGPTAGLPT